MKKPKLFVVILSGVCAITGVLKVILDIVDQTYDYNLFVFIMHAIAALLWIAAFVATMIEHRSGKSKKR